MTVEFKFECMLNLHNRNTYINLIKDEVEQNEAYKLSNMQININNIKSISKMSNGSALISLKLTSTLAIPTIEKYDEIVDVINKANIALNKMNKEKIYIFKDFIIDSKELIVE